MANVMISDVGGVASFDGRGLNRDDTAHLGKSDCIALTNWSANKRGNELARKLFALPGRRARLNFLDPADLSGAEGRIGPLRKIVDDGLVDVLSLNENETSIMMKVLSLGGMPKRYRARDVIEASAKLHAAFHTRIDVHTPIGSASACNEDQVWVPSPGLVKGYVTGAGDAWDAADIVGSLLRLRARERLQFANAYAYLHITRKTRAPNLKDVERFLQAAHGL
jgi:ribokinase